MFIDPTDFRARRPGWLPVDFDDGRFVRKRLCARAKLAVFKLIANLAMGLFS